MPRLTASLPQPSLDGRGGLNNRNQHPHRFEGKRHAQRARCDAGVTYEQIAVATGRSLPIVYGQLNVADERRQLTYADLIAMARHSCTRSFVAHLLAPIEQSIRAAVAVVMPVVESKPDGQR